jgi:hypothetical protein
MRQKIKSIEYLFYEDRLGTFETWPKQMQQDKFSLAAAGLFYKNQNDLCECFACGVKLRQWELYDDALNEHKKWSPECVFLKMIGYSVKLSVDCQQVTRIAANSQGNEQCSLKMDFPR